MEYYNLNIYGLTRKLPVIPVKKGVRVASFNLLGDAELVVILTKELIKKIKDIEFDYLIGPEVKVVPLLQELSRILRKKRYIVCRKEIHGYMVNPLKSKTPQSLVIDGSDAKILSGTKVIIVDDVVTSGKTMRAISDLMERLDTKIVAKISLFKQGDLESEDLKDLIYIRKLPVFAS
jgi:adenine phosphoribosyltransferase